MPNSNNKGKFNRKKKKVKQYDNYVPSGDPKALSMAIEQLGLKDKTIEVLKKGNVNTVSELITYREKELYRIQNFNKKNLLDVTDKVKSLGLMFRPDEQIAAPDLKNDRIKVYADGRIDEGRAIKTEKSFPEKQENKEIKNKTHEPVKEVLPPDALIKYNKGNKYGFKDVKGMVVIPPVYDEVFNFKEGLACVENNGRYGYIDRKNRLVIPYKYDLAMSFSEGLASVTLGEKSGYIDKEGNVKIDLRFDAATEFCEDSARVKIEGKWGIIDKTGKLRML